MSTLVNTDRKKDGEHEAHILQLPNELVSKILDLFIDSECPPGTIGSSSRARSIMIRLLRVCRRFRTIVIPRLYSELHIVSIVTKEGFAFNESTSLLHRTLKHNSEIRQHCQKLAISLHAEQEPGFDSSAKPQDSIFDLISWLSSTSHLSITGHQTTSQGVQLTNLSMLIGRALDCLPKLTMLRIHGTIFSLPSVLEGFGDMNRFNTNLSALEIDQIRDTENTPQWQVLQGLEGTAPIRKLKLKHYGQTPEFLEALMKWPAMLQKLSFRPLCAWSTGQSGLYTSWSFAVLQPILEVQMANLRELAILDLDTEDIKKSGLDWLEDAGSLEAPLDVNWI